jgi:hypothetical protein
MTPPAVAPATLAAAYEHLRAWVGGQAPPGPPHAGLALVIRQGLPGWLAAAPAWSAAAAQASLPSAGAAGRLATAPANEVAHVLAAMVAACRPLEVPQ